MYYQIIESYTQLVYEWSYIDEGSYIASSCIFPMYYDRDSRKIRRGWHDDTNDSLSLSDWNDYLHCWLDEYKTLELKSIYEIRII